MKSVRHKEDVRRVGLREIEYADQRIVRTLTQPPVPLRARRFEANCEGTLREANQALYVQSRTVSFRHCLDNKREPGSARQTSGSVPGNLITRQHVYYRLDAIGNPFQKTCGVDFLYQVLTGALLDQSLNFRVAFRPL